jgi:hypothetical protein
MEHSSGRACDKFLVNIPRVSRSVLLKTSNHKLATPLYQTQSVEIANKLTGFSFVFTDWTIRSNCFFLSTLSSTIKTSRQPLGNNCSYYMVNLVKFAKFPHAPTPLQEVESDLRNGCVDVTLVDRM